MPKSFVLTQAAKADLQKIALYTQRKWGRTQRNNYVRQFDEAFHRLSDSPQVGKVCNDLRAGYKKFPIGSHFIFYRNSENATIEIVRILHKRMDVESGLAGSR